MASAQIGGIVKFYKITPQGDKVLLYANSTRAIGTGGSSDGIIAQTQEKWSYIPVQNEVKKIMKPNDHLQLTFIAEANATTDASDGAVVLPMTLVGGSPLILGKLDSAVDWDVKVLGDVALLAGYETILAERTIREECAFGSNTTRAFLSIENNS
jgi:hypothetical protein